MTQCYRALQKMSFQLLDKPLSTMCSDLQTADLSTYKDLVTQKFDARTEYDKDNDRHPEVAAKLVARAKLQRGWNVLDLACGTGLVTYLAAANVGPNGSIKAMDLSPGMIQQVLLYCLWTQRCRRQIRVKIVDQCCCRQRLNCTFCITNTLVLLWGMWSMHHFKTIHSMQFCAPHQFLTLTWRSLPTMPMHG